MLPIWSKFASPCRRPARWPQARRRPSALRPTLELLDRRDLPAVQLSYVGPGTPLFLEDLSAAVDNVTISEPSPNVLRIDLNGATFDPASAPAATGLAYQNAGSPATSTFATVDISTANAIANLGAFLTGPDDAVTLGLSNAVGGGVGSVSLEAGGRDAQRRDDGSRWDSRLGGDRRDDAHRRRGHQRPGSWRQWHRQLEH